MRARRAFQGLPPRAELVGLLPALGVLVTWVVLMPQYGGYFPRVWLWTGPVLLTLLGIAIIAGRRALPGPTAVRAPLLAFAAFTGWHLISLLWSAAPGKAWDATNLLLICLLSAWVLALAPWRASTAAAAMTLFSLAAAVTCLVSLVGVLDETDLTSRFADSRFQPPLGYPNTTAAFAMMAALPMLVFASRPRLAAPLAALAQALATFLAAYALLPLSRGAALGSVAVAVILLAVLPWRWRAAINLLVLGGTVAAFHGPLVEVYNAAAETRRAGPALEDALWALLAATAVGFVLGGAISFVARRIILDDRGRRVARAGGVAAVAGLLLAVGAVGAANSEGIGNAVSDEWRSLKNPGVTIKSQNLYTDNGADRFRSLEALERYDYWRVALDGFRANPVGGLGAGGFEHRYMEDRRYPKTTRYPHNLTLKVLGDTGIVGLGLLAAFAALVGRGLLRRRGDGPPDERAVVAAAVVVAGYFFVHGQFDWLETYPVVTGPALGWLMVALVVRHRETPPAPHRRRHTVLVTAGIVLAAASLFPPLASSRYVQHASAVAGREPLVAYRDLDRAARLNPLAIDALLQRGALALERGNLRVARDSFERAIDRENTWLGHLGVALVEVGEGDRLAGAGQLVRAMELNPMGPTIPTIVPKILTTSDPNVGSLFQEAQDTGLFRISRVR